MANGSSKTGENMAKNVVVVGTQWGDEGKGKIVDWLTDRAAGVVRFQGGHNAGHTLVVGDKVFKLSLVPSGIVRGNVRCFIGNGVVLDMAHLTREIAMLENAGLEVQGRLMVSAACPVILPYHVALDAARENKRSKNNKIGTTGKGIGPCYEDKVARRGLKLYEFFDSAHLKARLKELLDYHNFMLTHFYNAQSLAFDAVYQSAFQNFEQILPMVGDVSAALNESPQNLLFEGAQGTLLDIDYGTYPFVTSSNCVAGQAAAGSGIGPTKIDAVLGITKAYCTRVGGGPFPSELDIETEGSPGYQMSHKGMEFGTVTGRRRRCGWLDIAALKRSAQINGLTGLCITKLDVLDGLPEIKICTGYSIDGKFYDLLPPGALDVEKAEPILQSVPGWRESTAQIKRFEDLPANARAYLGMIEVLAEVPIALVSTGPEREETIVKHHPFD